MSILMPIMSTISQTIKINDKKTINGWAIYDWAYSAYFLVISTAIFPAYFLSNTPEMVQLFGMEMSNSSLYSYAVSFSYIVIVMLSPFLSGIADFETSECTSSSSLPSLDHWLA